jgi:hypothetical protein
MPIVLKHFCWCREISETEMAKLGLGPTEEFLTKAKVQPQEVEGLVLSMVQRIRTKFADLASALPYILRGAALRTGRLLRKTLSSELHFTDNAAEQAAALGGSGLLHLCKCFLGASGGAVGDAAESGKAAGDWAITPLPTRHPALRTPRHALQEPDFWSHFCPTGTATPSAASAPHGHTPSSGNTASTRLLIRKASACT